LTTAMRSSGSVRTTFAPERSSSASERYATTCRTLAVSDAIALGAASSTIAATAQSVRTTTLTHAAIGPRHSNEHPETRESGASSRVEGPPNPGCSRSASLTDGHGSTHVLDDGGMHSHAAHLGAMRTPRPGTWPLEPPPRHHSVLALLGGCHAARERRARRERFAPQE
jgi:hypothetical protein